ncbi:MAG: hypothetical protein R3C10_17860 [Pirellulales bacterium]
MELYLPGEPRRRWSVQSHVTLDINAGSLTSGGIGDQFRQGASRSKWLVGYHPQADERIVMKFTVPEMTAEVRDIGKVVLRPFVSDAMNPLRDGLDIFHSVADNEFQTDKADYEAPYGDTGLDLVVPEEGSGRYYDFDVTEFVRQDFLAGETIPLTAFRLQFNREQDFDGGVPHGYIIDTQRFAPQLLITFIPEPGTAALAAFGWAVASSWRCRRHAGR